MRRLSIGSFGLGAASTICVFICLGAVGRDAKDDGLSEHLKLGTPERREQVLDRKGFVLLHDNQRKIPLWAAYHLTPADLKRSRPRLPSGAFAADDELPDWAQAHPSDYRRAGWDRGHLVPSADMRRSDAIQKQSFLLSNVAPQNTQLNRHSWKMLEDHVRDWAEASTDLYVYVGTIPPTMIKTIGKNRVVVPAAFYKIVIRQMNDKWHAIGFVTDNEDDTGDPSDWITKISDIEILTGFCFLSAIPQAEREALKDRLPKDLNDW